MSRREFDHALIVGKFFPPHVGHEYLVRTALQFSRRVTVLVLAASSEPLPMEIRAQWLRQCFPELVARERTTKSYRRAGWGIVLRPWLWPAAALYAWVTLETRRRAREQFASLDVYVWESDRSSRRPDRR